MAKKQNKPAQRTQPQQTEVLDAPIVEATPEAPKSILSKLYDFKLQAIIVALIAFVIYFNSFDNEFAHDDGIVIVKNEYVLEGFAGIPNIFSKDAYDSYYRQLNTTNQLKGGRFRPLSIVTFAIEQEFFGAVPVEKADSVVRQSVAYGVAGPGQEKMVRNMHVRHFFNVMWYMLSVVVLLYFLRYVVFKSNPLMAFVAALLFTAHPIHTEVVANVKSRDEIMSLLFMCLTFIFAFKYEENKKNPGHLVAALASYLLAFLSKEYAITILGLLPLAFVVFRNYSIPKAITNTLPYMVVITVYLALRINVLAPATEEDATNFVLSAFPKLGMIAGFAALFLYARKPKKAMTDMEALKKNVIYFLPHMFFAVIYLYMRLEAVPPVTESAAKEVLNNPYLFATPIQKTATEISTSLDYLKLLIFPHPLSADYSFDTIKYKDFAHPMVWLSILVHVGLLVAMFMWLPLKKSASAAGKPFVMTGKHLMSFAIAFYFIHLLLVNNMVFDIGATMGERLIYHSSVGFVIAVAYLLVKGAEKIKPIQTGHMALAALLVVVTALYGFKTADRNKAWKNDSTLFGTDIKTVPNSVLVNANVAAAYITLADLQNSDTARKRYLVDAVHILDHTLMIHRKFVAAFLNRGIAWYKLGNPDKAKANVDTVRMLYPTYPTLPGMYKLISEFYLRNGWEAYGKFGKFPEAVAEYKKGLVIDSTNADLWYNVGGAYYSNKQYAEAMQAFQMSLKYKPGNQQAQNGVNASMQLMNQANAQRK